MVKANTIHFDISERKILLRILDVVFIFTTLYLTRLLFDFDYFVVSFERLIYALVLIIYFTILGSVFELYDLQKSSQFEATIKNVILTVLVTVLLYLLTPRYTPTLPTQRIQILFFVLAIVAGLLTWRYLYITFFATSRFNKRVLLVANGADLNPIITILEKTDPNYRISAVLDTAENGFSLPADIKQITTDTLGSEILALQISEVIVASRTGRGITAELNNRLMDVLGKGVPVRSFVSAYEDLTKRIPVHHVETDFYDYFPFSRSNQNKLYLLTNRLFDVVVAIVGLAFGLALSPFIMMGNFFGNRGPLFYHQIRVGKHGGEFKLYKFRTMVENAEINGAQFSFKGDTRITKFGKFLRRSRIDEIPQFINVLKGEMSLIGPRPERPEFVGMLSEKIPFYEVRHAIKPGITGWAQVKSKYGENESDSLEKLQYDLYYIKHRSVFLDLIIIIKTLSTILFFRGQ